MFVNEPRPSGLLLARESMDEASACRGIEQMTGGGFSLQKRRRHEDDPDDVVYVYKVVHVATGEIVYTWMDGYGRPLPLSSGLLDGFQQHLNGHTLGEDAYNQRALERLERDREAETEALVADHRPHVERERLSVALGLGKPRYWRREGAKPQSGRRS